MQGIDTWVVAALRHDGNAAHASIAQVLEWIERIKPRRAVLTHLSSSVDYEKLASQLPNGVEPAYDGMVLDVDD